MAAVSSAFSCVCGSYSRNAIPLYSPPPYPSLFCLPSPSHFPMGKSLLSSSSFPQRRKIITSTAAVPEGALAPAEDDEIPTPTDEPTVSVPVSPSDVLTMFFQAEGTMDEVAIPAVRKALEKIEGISDLKVQILEGIANVQLTKQTTVQATGVASNLVEVIQGSGFKLQALNLSFEDEEDMN